MRDGKIFELVSARAPNEQPNDSIKTIYARAARAASSEGSDHTEQVVRGLRSMRDVVQELHDEGLTQIGFRRMDRETMKNLGLTPSKKFYDYGVIEIYDAKYLVGISAAYHVMLHPDNLNTVDSLSSITPRCVDASKDNMYYNFDAPEDRKHLKKSLARAAAQATIEHELTQYNVAPKTEKPPAAAPGTSLRG